MKSTTDLSAQLISYETAMLGLYTIWLGTTIGLHSAILKSLYEKQSQSLLPVSDLNTVLDSPIMKSLGDTWMKSLASMYPQMVSGAPEPTTSSKAPVTPQSPSTPA